MSRKMRIPNSGMSLEVSGLVYVKKLDVVRFNGIRERVSFLGVGRFRPAIGVNVYIYFRCL